MIGELLSVARHMWWIILTLPAALGQLWGQPAWLSVAGVSCLLLSAVFSAAAAYWRGNVDGIHWTQELYRR